MHHGNSRFGSKPQHLLNHQIKAATVRLLNDEGEQLGVIPTSQALKLARDTGTDLIEISGKAVPPVCLLCDYGKYAYRMAKKEKESRESQHKLKEIQLSANIDPHDSAIKARHAGEFLDEGHPVRVSMILRGREKAHPEVGRETFNLFLEELVKRGFPRSSITQNGSQFLCLLHGRRQTQAHGKSPEVTEELRAVA